MRTITLKQELTFSEALPHLIDGTCIGIKPGNNGRFVIKYRPHWMNPDSKHFLLCWERTVEDGIGNEGITTEQYLGPWYLVVIDCNDLSENAKLLFTLKNISGLKQE